MTTSANLDLLNGIIADLKQRSHTQADNDAINRLANLAARMRQDEENAKVEGWSNFETWTVNIHLFNDRNLRQRFLYLMWSDKLTRAQRADLFKEGYEELLDLDNLTHQAAQLATVALNRVNWDELAQVWRNDALEQRRYDEQLRAQELAKDQAAEAKRKAARSGLQTKDPPKGAGSSLSDARLEYPDAPLMPPPCCPNPKCGTTRLVALAPFGDFSAGIDFFLCPKCGNAYDPKTLKKFAEAVIV